MTTRRQMLKTLGIALLAAHRTSNAQPPSKAVRIGYLGATSANQYTRQVAALREGLRELGYVEGKNYSIEFRWADNQYDLLPRLAAELVGLKVDLIVTSGPATIAAKNATSTLPIVAAVMGDPLATGLVTSLARPGGNITGLSFFAPELLAKRVEIIKDTMPEVRRIGVLLNAALPVGNAMKQAVESTARGLKLDAQIFGVSGPAEFEQAFAGMRKQRIEALATADDSMLVANAPAVVKQIWDLRVPTIGFIEIAEGGGLMAYAVDFPPMYRRAAVMIDKIASGAKPGEIPIERATRFNFVINLKAAKSLGVKIPNSVLLRAERVIE